MLTRAKFLRLSGATAAAALAATPEAYAKAKANDGVVRVKSAFGFLETIERLKKDIAAKGIKFFDEISIKARSRRRHQAQSIDAAGVRQSTARHAVHDVEPECRVGLAGAAAGDPGPCRCGMDGLHRLRLDRRATRHRQSRRSIQDGVDGNRFHQVERAGVDGDARGAWPRIARCYRDQSDPAFP
jgi:hypothetical protein